MKKKLRTGFTTGTAAAAATKGALSLLLDGKPPRRVTILLLTGDTISIPVHRCESEGPGRAVCTVIKDAGDDPDVTHRAEIGARVTLIRSSASGNDIQPAPRILIRGGEGVGRVTKPGLEVPPGQPAINPGPLKMITQAAEDILATHGASWNVETQIFVPRGKKLAEKTLNARLGILDGISILGTTGIVKPMSHESFIATIKSALSVARASGLSEVVMTTGRRSERFAQNYRPGLPGEAFIQIGDFFQKSMKAAAAMGFEQITIAVFFAKALKMAQGVPHTHAAKSALTLNTLCEWVLQLTGDRKLSERIRSANTARHAFDTMGKHRPAVIAHLGGQIVRSAQRFAGKRIGIRSVIFDYSGGVVFDSTNH